MSWSWSSNPFFAGMGLVVSLWDTDSLVKALLGVSSGGDCRALHCSMYITISTRGSRSCDASQIDWFTHGHRPLRRDVVGELTGGLQWDRHVRKSPFNSCENPP